MQYIADKIKQNIAVDSLVPGDCLRQPGRPAENCSQAPGQALSLSP